MPFGVDQVDWTAAKDEIRTLLANRARAKSVISYSELVSHVRAVSFTPHDKRLFSMLGEISREETARGRGMLSVLVVHKSGDMQPGPGFFELAKELGRDTSDVLTCWISEFNHVCDAWRA